MFAQVFRTLFTTVEPKSIPNEDEVMKDGEPTTIQMISTIVTTSSYPMETQEPTKREEEL